MERNLNKIGKERSQETVKLQFGSCILIQSFSNIQKADFSLELNKCLLGFFLS